MDAEKFPAGKPSRKKFLVIFLFLSGAFLIIFSLFSLRKKPDVSPTPSASFSTQNLSDSSETPKISPRATPAGSPSPTPPLKTISLSATKGLDGFVATNGAANVSSDIRAGRNKYLVTRGVLGFDLKLPRKANLASAILRLYQTKVVGNPYLTLGDLKIDFIDLGESIEAEDYANPAEVLSFAALSSDNKIGWRQVDVSEILKMTLQKNPDLSSLGFRIHFSREVLGETAGGDFVHFESSRNSFNSGNIPEMVLKYN